MSSTPTRQLALATFLVTGILYAACGGVDETPFEPVAPITPGVSFTLDLDGDSYSCDYELIGGFIIDICSCDDPSNTFFYSASECVCSFNCAGGWFPVGGGGAGTPPPGGAPLWVEVWCAPIGSGNSGASASVPRGEQATCGYTLAPAGVTVVPIEWTIMGVDVPSNTQAGGNTWTGKVAVGGNVRLKWSWGGEEETTAPRQLQVDPRSWSWDGSKRTFAQASGTQLDSCMGSDNGLTADPFGCTSGNPGIIHNPGPNQGFTISQGTEMNAGVFYVTNPTTRMDIRYQLAKKFRADDTKRTITGNMQALMNCELWYDPNPVPQLNNHGLNTTCFSSPVSGFTTFVAATWAHEAQHSDLLEQEAVKPINDLYAEWEGLVQNSYDAAFTAANLKQGEIMGRVQAPSAALDTVPPHITHSFWRHFGSSVWTFLGTKAYWI